MDKNDIEKEIKRKSEIKKELISKDLSDSFKILIVLLFIAGLFGYFGYLYAIDTNGEILREIISR